MNDKAAAELLGQLPGAPTKLSEDPTKVTLQTNVKKHLDPTIVRMKGVAIHGNVPFDVPFISQINGNLWQGGCQNGLILPKFFKHVISLYPWERYTVKHELDSMLTVKMYDSIDQATNQIDGIAHWVNTCRADGPTLVHCQAGLNRSSLVVARAMMLCGRTSWYAIDKLREKRSLAVLCNPAFEEYIRSLD